MTEKRKAPRAGGNQSGQNKDSENALIFKALTKAKRPLTRRELSQMTGLEIANLCRALYDLVYFYPYTIVISHYAPCKTTGLRVMHYYFNPENRKEASHELK